MPKNVSKTATMTKHLTLEEKQSREKADRALSREKIKLHCPAKVRKNAAAKAYWKLYVRKAEELELLDDVDSDMLGAYCMILARLDRIQEALDESEELDMDIVTKLESTERNAITYAQRLGLTPESRARLAKRRAEAEPPDPNADLFGEL